jgi:hypothetical protein
VSDTEWRWADPSGQQRLLRTDELRAALASGQLAPNTPVWREGWTEWRPAQDVPELVTKPASNGAAHDVPAPPLAMMAAQRAFEATPLIDTTPGTPAAAAAANARKGTVPPPPPTYVPTPASTQLAPPPPPPSSPRASSIPTAPVVPVAPASSPRPSGGKLPPDASAGLAALDLQVARAKTKDLDAPSAPRPSDPHERATAIPGEPKPPPMAIASLVKSAPPPPLPARATSRPPPPKSKAPPKPLSRPPTPPPVKSAPPEMIEELSGSVLLADRSGSNSAITELSGSMLLPDLSAAVSPAQALQAVRAAEELTGSFLVDAGSTGALPSVESTGKILAAKAAARAPFAADPPDQTATVPKVIVPPDEAATVVIPPVGATPPPSTAHTGPAVPAAGAFTPPVPSVTASRAMQPVAEPLMVAPPAVAPEYAALPTFVGVPPPPDALVRQQEEFEASLPKVEVASERAPAVAPVVAPVAEYAPSEPLPPPERSTARLHDFREISRDPRAKYIVPAVGVFGLVVMIGVIGLVVGVLRKKPSEEPEPVATTADTSPTANVATVASAPSPNPASAPAAAPASPGAACALAGAAHVVAPRAVVQSGVEANVVGGHIALGFATRDRDGIAVEVDPSSLAATRTARAHVHAPDVIRRLVPVLTGETFGASADVDHAGDFLAGRRTVAAPAPFDLGFGGGGLSWAPHRSSEADLVWTLDGDAPVEAVRAAPLDPAHDDAGWAIAFRRGTSIYAGAVGGGATRTPKGPLVSVAGLGAQVGSPAIAAQDGAVVVAWADRAQPSDPWSLRWMRFAPGDATADAKGFVPSEGGLGEHAMSPAIAAAGSGRFVLAWTEGPVSNHQVRAQTITAGGVPIGVAMSISDSGVNAGQAQVAIRPDGRGVVAYLASSGGGPKAPYEVLATPIACP